jgi:hypothetical protein
MQPPPGPCATHPAPIHSTNLEDQAAGLILANEPWSGHWYSDSPPIWTGALWTQFTSPGWRFLSVPSGGSGHLPSGGTYVSLVPPSGTGLTLILETFGSQAGRCKEADAAATQTVVFALKNAPLPGPGASLFCWTTTQSAPMVRQPDIVVAADGTFSITIAQFTMMTITTVAGGKKGAPAAPVPAAAPFPLPFEDNFDESTYAYDAMAHYFSDQFGSFAVRNGSLAQVAWKNPGKLAWSGDTDPFTLVGDVSWADVEVSAGVVVPPAPSVSAGGRAGDGAPAQLVPCANVAEQRWTWSSTGPTAGYLSNTDSAGSEQCLNAYGCERTAVYWSCVTTGGTCCGADCYDGLVFSLDAASGQVQCRLPAVGCLTKRAGGALTFADCAPQAAPLANQTFAFDAASGHLRFGAGADALCLSQPPPPPPPVVHAQVCARIAGYQAFSLPKPPPGYCLSLALDGSAAWTLTSAAGTLSNGTITPAPVPGSVVVLAVKAVGAAVTASADGVALAAVSSTAHPSGMAGLGSSFDEVRFDNFAVKPAA